MNRPAPAPLTGVRGGLAWKKGMDSEAGHRLPSREGEFVAALITLRPRVRPAGRLVASGAASRNTSSLKGSMRSSPNSGKRNRQTVGLPSVHPKTCTQALNGGLCHHDA